MLYKDALPASRIVDYEIALEGLVKKGLIMKKEKGYQFDGHKDGSQNSIQEKMERELVMWEANLDKIKRAVIEIEKNDKSIKD